MPRRIPLTKLIVVIKPIRPNVSPSTVDFRILWIPRLQQRRRRGPVIRRAPRIERFRLANPESVGDLMKRGPLIHVRPAGAESDVAIEVSISGGNAGNILDRDRFVRADSQLGIARDSQGHGRLDLGVCLGLVQGGVCALLQFPGDDC